MAIQKTVHGKDALKRRDADVIKHGTGPANPDKHWVQKIGYSAFDQGYGNDPAGAFLCRPGKDRAQPHKKINECDH